MTDLDALPSAHSHRHAFSIPPWAWRFQIAGAVDALSLSGWAASAKLDRDTPLFAQSALGHSIHPLEHIGFAGIDLQHESGGRGGASVKTLGGVEVRGALVCAKRVSLAPVPPQDLVDGTIVDVSTLGVKLAYPDAPLGLRRCSSLERQRPR